MSLTHLIFIALAGAAGTLCRFGLSNLMTRLCGEGFPYGTLAANLLGCFLFGVVLTFAEGRFGLQQPWRGILLVGFMGAFTTFSTFAADSSIFLRDGAPGYAVLNILANTVLGISLFFAGMWLGRQF